MKELPIALFRPDDRPNFPDPLRALQSPNGLLAAGGNLSVPWLVEAYAHGIFPWFGKDEPILWWSPDPRCGFHTDAIHVSRRLRRQLRQLPWTIHADIDFRSVIEACAAPRQGSPGTWLTRAMIDAYCDLHAHGHAHSIEVRHGGELVGGLYGVAVGHVFCGESMFSGRSGGSKVALVALGQVLSSWGWPLLDAQVPNDHLISLGAKMLPRHELLAELRAGQTGGAKPGCWRETWPVLRADQLG